MRTLRNVLRPTAALASRLMRYDETGAVAILMYHRVTGDAGLELDLPFETFREQMALLRRTERVISLAQAVDDHSIAQPAGKLRFVITFDDAYEDFYTHALPVLEEFSLPATLYVPTGFIDNPGRPPISAKTVNTKLLRPSSWSMLQTIASTKRITIGGHTHNHNELTSLRDDEILRDLDRSDKLLQDKLGISVRHFAYPRGIWNDRVRNLVAPRYRTVTRADGGLFRPGMEATTNLPRIPVQRSDGMRWFADRIAGRLALEERLIARGKALRGIRSRYY